MGKYKDKYKDLFELFEFVLQMTGKDFRYMATSDILTKLNKDSFKVQSDLEIKLLSIIVQQLDDVAGDLSGLAVKWYGICLWFLPTTQTESFLLSSVGVL